jgi:hypothetical protein
MSSQPQKMTPEKAATTIQRYAKGTLARKKVEKMKEEEPVEKRVQRKKRMDFHPEGAETQMAHNAEVGRIASRVVDAHRDKVPIFKKPEVDKVMEGKPFVPMHMYHYNFYNALPQFRKKMPEPTNPTFVKHVLDRAFKTPLPIPGIYGNYMTDQKARLDYLKKYVNEVGREGLPKQPSKTGGKK